ncbi:MAG: hypothetical protein VX910_10290 [Candidatus Latescibacterota bacterium]|nr:hypothetical protein [Candidatus Latescibacterota bacterium]
MTEEEATGWSTPLAGARKWLLACTSGFWFAHYTYVPTLAPYAEYCGGSFAIIGLIVIT